jgi:excisionase family DNA binding protein
MTSRARSPSDSNIQAVSGHARGRRNSGLPKYYPIKAVAEALDVSPRTVRRWIANGDLIAHLVDRVVRVADTDLRTFLALHRERQFDGRCDEAQPLMKARDRHR